MMAGKGVFLMQILSNPHTHTTYSDGQCTPEEMVLRAIELGFTSLGISDHSVQPFDDFFTIPAAREAEYCCELRALNAKYGDRIRVHVGVELDAFAGLANRPLYDYLLLAGHYIEKDGVRSFVDSHEHRDELFSLRDIQFKGDSVAFAARYFDILGEKALQVKPDIVGHFDLVKVFNGEGGLYDESSPEFRRVRQDALEKIYRSGALLEINTGGMARGKVDEPYPSRAIIALWREMGGRVILGSDSHHAETLNFAFDSMRDLLLAEGFESVWALGGPGETLFVEHALR